MRNGYYQEYQAQVEKNLRKIQLNFNIPVGASFKSLQESHQLELIRLIENNMLKKYVQGDLYADTGRLLYEFSKKDRKVTLTLSGFEFSLKFQTTIFKLTNYEMAKFL